MYHQNFITYVNFVIDFGESKLFVLKVNIFNVIGDNFQLFLYIHYITDDLSYNKLATQSPIYRVLIRYISHVMPSIEIHQRV